MGINFAGLFGSRKHLGATARTQPALTELTRYGTGSLQASAQSRPGSVPIRVFKKMRLDAQIALATSAVKAPITGVTWWATSRNEDAARFVEAALEPVWPDLIRAALAAFDFGFQPCEKVWRIRDVEYEFAGALRVRRGVVYGKLRDLDPETVEILLDARGDFAGLRCDGVFIPVEKCFVMTLDRQWGNLYGQSRLEPAYEPWYWAGVMYLFANRYFERKGDPSIIGRAPAEERTDAEGNRVRTLDEAARVISSLRSGGTAVFPDERDEYGNLRWDFRYLVDDKRADMFIAYIEHLQAMKLRALLVPERTVTQDAASGSFAMASEHTETFLRNEETLLSQIIDHLNRYIVAPLVEYNFGGETRVRIETGGVRRKNEALLKDILFKVIDAEKSGACATADLVDAVKVLEQLNVARKAGSARRGNQ